MKILLVNPKFPNSFWSFQGLKGLVENLAHTPLGLATVAALTPPEIEVQIVDENVEKIDFETDAQVVGFTAFNVQLRRAIELAGEFRKRGKKVVIGGAYVSLLSQPFEEYFDSIFVGEAENIWPEFCRDLMNGSIKPRYTETEKVDLTRSPVPRYDLLKKNQYNAYYLQTSRGCPFNCEFCDIIITNGRTPRLKSLDQVMAEVESVRQLGGNSITFSDANFIGNPKYAKEVLKRLAEFGKKYNYPIRFTAELTINVADREDLLTLMEEANFAALFIGIESPRSSSLAGSHKGVNLVKPLLESIRKIQRHNICPWAGMIVGFDQDDHQIFQEQFDFLMEAGIPFTTSGILVAIPTTALYERLEKENRLVLNKEQFRKASEKWCGHGADNLNFIPKLMTKEELLEGYGWMIRKIYSYENFARRLEICMQNFKPPVEQFPGRKNQESARIEAKQGLKILMRTLKYYLLTKDSMRRRFFVKTLFRALKGRWTQWNFNIVVAYLVIQKHFYEYVTETQGRPEDAPALSPFHGRAVPKQDDGVGIRHYEESATASMAATK